MKMKKDLEFTPPLEEYEYPEEDSNCVLKKEFYQSSISEVESVQEKKNWKKKMRHLLTAGITVMVMVLAIARSVPEEEQVHYDGEFDIEIAGSQFHLPCQLSEALDLAEREGNPLQRRDYDAGEWDVFDNWIDASGNWVDSDFLFRAYTNEAGKDSVREYLWNGIWLSCREWTRDVPLFNYKGVTAQSAWEDCISALGVPDYYYLSGDSLRASWFSRPSVSIGIQNGKMYDFHISILSMRPPYYTIQKNGTDTEADPDKWFSIDDAFTDTNTGCSLDGIYIFDTDKGLPDHIEDIPGENILESNGNASGNTIQIPKPEFEHWSIAFVYNPGYGDQALIYNHVEELLKVSGGRIILSKGNENVLWGIRVEFVSPKSD